MTARREARRARLEVAVRVAEGEVHTPAELLNRDHAVWADRDKYAAWMKKHGLTLTAGDRMSGRGHPHNRRNHASAQWAEVQGICTDRAGRADWNQLRRAGLIG